MVKIDSKLFYEKEIIVDGWKQSLENCKKDIRRWSSVYAEIYKNNKKIINDPDLIFPGQVFKIPNLKRASFYE